MAEVEGSTRMYPLARAQRRIWYEEQFNPGTSLHNIGGVVTFEGEVDLSVLAEAIRAFLDIHVAARLRITERNWGGDVWQYVALPDSGGLEMADFSGEPDPQLAFERWVERHARTPFEILDCALHQFSLFRVSERQQGYLVKFHHLIADGWSMALMTQHVIDLYRAMVSGSPRPSEPNMGYLDMLAAEAAYERSERFALDREFWLNQLSTPPDHILPRRSQLLTARRTTYELDGRLSATARACAAEVGGSLNAFFTMVLALAAYKSFQRQSMIIGLPVLNRSGKQERAAFGMRAGTMPLRIDIDPGETCGTLLNRIRAQLKAGHAHQLYPYELIVRDVAARTGWRDPLYQVCMNFYGTRPPVELFGVPVRNEEFFNGNQTHALQLVVREWSSRGGIRLDLDTNVEDFSADEADGVYQSLERLIDQVARAPHTPMRNLDVSPDPERSVLRPIATDISGPTHRSVCELIDEQARRTPGHIALEWDGGRLTYADLAVRVSSLAGYLRDHGVRPSDIVGLVSGPHTDAVVAMLAIMRCGAAYLPLDPDLPLTRLAYMLEGAAVSFVLTTVCPTPGLAFGGHVVGMSDLDLGEYPAAPLPAYPLAYDRAYIMYTSGSTGMPKAVVVTHGALAAYTTWASRTYLDGPEEVVPLWTSLAVDMTVTSALVPLLSGCRIVIYRNDPEDPEHVLLRIVREDRCTFLKLTPAHLVLLRDARLAAGESRLRRLVVGGEQLSGEIVRSIAARLGHAIEVVNEYGPTEATVGCMIQVVDPAEVGPSVPVGRPIPGMRVYLLDSELRLVPDGCVGEMYIAGAALAEGYLGRPGLTAERFLPDPLQTGARMYRTGDLGRVRGGVMYCLGRIDRQVKVRGYRVEIGEVEHHLLQVPFVRECAVIGRQDDIGFTYLCAYVALDNPMRTGEDVRAALLGTVPDHIIPGQFVEVNSLPLTPAGKVDRRMLNASPQESGGAHRVPGHGHDSQLAPLADVLRNVLEIEQVGPGDNFFHLGGDSIKAIQIAARLKGAGLRLLPRQILAHPVVEDMAACLVAGDMPGGARDQDEAVPAGKFDTLDLSSDEIDELLRSL